MQFPPRNIARTHKAFGTSIGDCVQREGKVASAPPYRSNFLLIRLPELHLLPVIGAYEIVAVSLCESLESLIACGGVTVRPDIAHRCHPRETLTCKHHHHAARHTLEPPSCPEVELREAVEIVKHQHHPAPG